LALAILVALVASASAYVLIERERERRFLELEGRATRIAELFSRSVAYPLWNVDRAEIDSQLAALSPNPEVAQFSITAVGDGTVSAVTKVQGPQLVDPIVRVQAIEYLPPGSATTQKIGEVRVVLTRAVVEEAIASARRAIVGLVAATVAVLYAVTFVLLRRMVSAPIGRLEVMVDKIAVGDLDARCAIESGDELGRLAMRVNAMADRLRESDRRLRESEATYRGIFENSLEGIFRLDRSGGLHDANPALARLMGYATPAELMAVVNGDGPASARRPLFTPAQVAAQFAALARTGEIAGMCGYSSAYESLYETCTRQLGLDPKSVQGLGEFSEQVVELTRQMALHHRRFVATYQAVMEMVADGTQMPYNGRFITGEAV